MTNTRRFHIQLSLDVQITEIFDDVQIIDSNLLPKKKGRKKKPFIFEFQSFSEDTQWVESILAKQPISIEEMHSYLTDFINYCIATGKEHNNYSSAKTHFYNWLKKALSKKSKESPDTNVDDALALEQERINKYRNL
jgi:hypothetical protein